MELSGLYLQNHYLEFRQDFSNRSSKRTSERDLVENEDFGIFHKFMKNPSEAGGRLRIDYWLTLVAAKEFGMLERQTDPTRQPARQPVPGGCVRRVLVSGSRAGLCETWIKDRLEKFQLLNGQDYNVCSPNSGSKECGVE
jgi:phage anti-repressor protein